MGSRSGSSACAMGIIGGSEEESVSQSVGQSVSPSVTMALARLEKVRLTARRRRRRHPRRRRRTAASCPRAYCAVAVIVVAARRREEGRKVHFDHDARQTSEHLDTLSLLSWSLLLPLTNVHPSLPFE